MHFSFRWESSPDPDFGHNYGALRRDQTRKQKIQKSQAKTLQVTNLSRCRSLEVLLGYRTTAFLRLRHRTKTFRPVAFETSDTNASLKTSEDPTQNDANVSLLKKGSVAFHQINPTRINDCTSLRTWSIRSCVELRLRPTVEVTQQPSPFMTQGPRNSFRSKQTFSSRHNYLTMHQT